MERLKKEEDKERKTGEGGEQRGEGEEVEEGEGSSHGMLERCSVADGGKMLLKFLEPGFLKRWRAEPEKS